MRSQISNVCRNLYVTHVAKNAYEGPGKTTVTFISKEIGSRLLVTRCDEVTSILHHFLE